MPNLVESPDIKQLGAEALRDLLNNLTQAKGFILDQAPEFCQQMVTRGMVLPAFVGAISMMVALALSIAVVWALWTGPKNGWPLAQSLVGIYGSVGVIITAVASAIRAHEALSVYVAPKVFLVEELTRMLR